MLFQINRFNKEAVEALESANTIHSFEEYVESRGYGEDFFSYTLSQ